MSLKLKKPIVPIGPPFPITPPPTLTLVVVIRELPTALSVTNVDWLVMPELPAPPEGWGRLPITLNGQTASIRLPNPGSSQQYNFTVTGTVNLSLNGSVNGVFYPPQQISVPIVCPAGICTFAWKGQNLTLAWEVFWTQVSDGSGNIYVRAWVQSQGPLA
jgi:hypothetical protein